MFVFLNVFPLNQPEVMIGNAASRFDEAGHLTDQTSRRLIRECFRNSSTGRQGSGVPQNCIARDRVAVSCLLQSHGPPGASPSRSCHRRRPAQRPQNPERKDGITPPFSARRLTTHAVHIDHRAAVTDPPRVVTNALKRGAYNSANVR